MTHRRRKVGTSYDTAAEVRFLQRIGGHAAGMSIVSEVIAARQLGLRVVGLSCITNLATGLSKHKLSHDEAKDTAARVERVFAEVPTDFTLAMAAELR